MDINTLNVILAHSLYNKPYSMIMALSSYALPCAYIVYNIIYFTNSDSLSNLLSTKFHTFDVTLEQIGQFSSSFTYL